MKYNIFKSLLACGALLAVAGCSENSWNEDYLDDFEVPSIYPGKMTAEYTLASKDYKAIAELQENIDKATAAGVLAQLEAVGANGYFNDAITPAEYLPAFLNSVKANTSYPLYYLNPKSSLVVTFKSGAAQPAIVGAINDAANYEVTTADYQGVWGSDENYAESFAPSKKPAKYIPAMLEAAFTGDQTGKCVYVTYNESAQEPVFGGAAPEAPSFELSSVIGTIALNNNYTVDGVVSGICDQGLMVTDNTGTIFIYGGSSFPYTDYRIGDYVTVSGKASAYNGGLQLGSPEIEMEGYSNAGYEYPAPEVLNETSWNKYYDEYSAKKTAKDGALPVYVEAKVKVTKASGYTVNFTMGASQTVGTLYRALNTFGDLFTVDTEATITAYVMSANTSKDGVNQLNFLLVAVNGTPVYPSTAQNGAKAPVKKVASVPAEAVGAVYTNDGSAWAPVANAVVVQASDYASMGVSNFSATTVATYIPRFLKQQFPYAASSDEKYVVCKYYDSASKVTLAHHCERAVYDGTEWTLNNIETLTDKFALNGKTWVYDPSVTLDFPRAGYPQASKDFYQACVNWVYENIDVPEFGDNGIKSGKGYVTSYGNNEYYSGASAYQCEIDLRPAAAKEQCPTGWAGKDDEQIVADMKAHFEKQVCPAVLHELYPDQMPGNGVDLYYYVNFIAYDGSDTVTETATYLVTAKGEYKYVSCTWND